MLELLIKTKPQAVDSFFKIDFTDAEVGSQVLPVSAQTPVNLQRVIRNADNSDGVVDHPTYGKCYRFTGNVMFRDTATANFLNLNRKPKYTLTLEFVTETVTSMPYYTGRDGTTTPGFMVYTWTGTTWSWVTIGAGGGGSTHLSVAVPGVTSTPLNTRIKMQVIKDGNNFTIVSNGASRYWTGINASLLVNDSAFCIGSTAVPWDTVLKGYLISMDVKLTA